MWCFGILAMYCAVQQAPPPADTYCKITRPIYWSSKDTRKTKEAADTHNRVYKRLCRK